MPVPAFIATIFGGKAKEIASDVLGGLDNLFTSKEEKLAAKLKIEEQVNSHIEKMTELANSEVEMYLKDTQDARSNNTKIQESDKASWLAKNLAYILDITFTVSFIVMLFVIIYKQVPESNKELFYTSFGLLGGYVSQILGFHRGTSKGSEEKSKELKELNKGK